MMDLNLSERDILALSAEDVTQLAARLEADEYDTAFDSLQDWHLLRAIAFRRPELADPYLYLLDLEPFDEA